MIATLCSWRPIGSPAQIVHASQDPNVATPTTRVLAWSPPEPGTPTPTTYILEAGTTPGASDVFNGNIGLTTSIAGRVGPGTYYVRVRAVNAAGVSPPSNEVTIIVGDGPPEKPIVSASVADNTLIVSWESGSGPTPSAHRLDFYSGAGWVASVHHGAETRREISIPPSTMGTFGVTVTAFNEHIAGPASELSFFTVESTCYPLAAPHVSGGLIGGIASVSWPSVPGASSYILSAGSTPGGTQFLPEMNVGANTTASASVKPDLRAWVRVTAVNACGERSAPGDLLVR